MKLFWHESYQTPVKCALWTWFLQKQLSIIFNFRLYQQQTLNDTPTLLLIFNELIASPDKIIFDLKRSFELK